MRTQLPLRACLLLPSTRGQALVDPWWLSPSLDRRNDLVANYRRHHVYLDYVYIVDIERRPRSEFGLEKLLKGGFGLGVEDVLVVDKHDAFGSEVGQDSRAGLPEGAPYLVLEVGDCFFDPF